MIFYQGEEVYGDGFYTICPNCKTKEPLEEFELALIVLTSGLSGTSMYCASCTLKGLVPELMNGQVVDKTSESTLFKSETLNVSTTALDDEVLMLDIWDEEKTALTACLNQAQVIHFTEILITSLHNMQAKKEG